MKRLYALSLNNNFFYQFEKELRKTHTIRRYRPLPGDSTGLLGWVIIGKTCQWADTIWCEFAQPPFDYAMALFPSKHIIVRVMRVEVYNEGIYELDWNAVDLAIFVSEHMEQRFYEKLNAANVRRGIIVNRPMKSVIIPGNLYDDEVFTFKERDFKKPYKVCIVGHLVPKKRQYTLVQMFKDLPPYFELDIVGGAGMPGYGNLEYEQNIKDLIEILGLEDRVRLLGAIPHEKMARFYQDHDILVSNSNEEGDALNVTEGMATGCYPLINSWRGADTHYGKEFVFRTPKEFVDRLLWWAGLSEEEKLRESIHARDYVYLRFRAGPLVEKVMKLVEEVESRDKVQAFYGHTTPEDIFQGKNARIVATIDWLKNWVKPGMSVLSLGCGIGLVEEALADSGAKVIGVDLSREKIEQARKRTKGKQNLIFAQVDATSGNMIPTLISLAGETELPTEKVLGLDIPTFDVVLMVDFIEHIHLEDHEDLLENFVSDIRPEGIIVVNMPSPSAPRGGRTPQPIDEIVEPEILVEEFGRYGFTKVLEKGPWLGGVYYRLVVSR